MCKATIHGPPAAALATPAGEPPSLVSVPTHFYKVVLTAGRRDPNQKQQQQAQAGDGPLAVAAFVMPNQPIDPKTPLSAFVVPLEPLEAVAGEQG